MSISIHESSKMGFSKVIETRLLNSLYARKKGSKVYTFPPFLFKMPLLNSSKNIPFAMRNKKPINLLCMIYGGQKG